MTRTTDTTPRSPSPAARQAVATTDAQARTFTMEIDINATPEDVWRALTDGRELVRWFPLQARVTPGEGGTMFWGWDERWAWESRIEGWEPGKRLTLVENRPAFDAKGDPLPDPAHTLAMEFTIETHAGQTRVRLVHSGFGRGANWDDELESVSAGWQFELRSLRHYVEQYKGRDRFQALAHGVTPLTMDVVWHELLKPDAFAIASGALRIDERCTIVTPAGDRLTGIVAWHKPQADLSILVDNLDGGIFRIATWRAAGQTGVQVWLTTYDARHQPQLRAVAGHAQVLIDHLTA
jgi:uncharacterized protein YndB with AHSA1/START domain